MEELKYLKDFNEAGKLDEENDEAGLLDFIHNRMEELVKMLYKTFSNPMTDEKRETTKKHFLNYAFEYKGKGLEELAADLCTLLCLLELIGLLEERKGDTHDR